MSSRLNVLRPIFTLYNLKQSSLATPTCNFSTKLTNQNQEREARTQVGIRLVALLAGLVIAVYKPPILQLQAWKSNKTPVEAMA